MVSYFFFFKFQILGVLRQGQKKEITITFTPDEAKVVIATAVFTFKEGEKQHTQVLKLSGIGKFPYVNISENKLNFE